MTYREVQDAILFYAGQTTGGNIETLVKVTCNGVYRRILDVGEVEHEQREFSITSVADFSQMGMPLYVRKVLNIDDATDKQFIFETTARKYDRTYPGTTETGTPKFSYPLGTRGVEKFPSADGVVSVQSDNALDTGANFKVRVTGFNAAGVLVSEQITMNGTTLVNSTNTFDSTLGVERVTKEPASGMTFTGNVTVKDAAANTLSIIPFWWLSPDYHWIEFHPGPSAARTYTVRCEMRKPPLINDGDWPEFDADFHDLLVWGTTMDLLPTLGKGDAAAAHRLTFKERLAEFTGDEGAAGRAIWVFSNVQNSSGSRQRPGGPYLEGVDVGLATGQ